MKPGATGLERIVRKFRGLEVGVLGDLMLDELVRGEATRISPEAPVPVVLVPSYAPFGASEGGPLSQGGASRAPVRASEAFPGGAGNVAANVASLGGRAVVFGAIGPDAAGRRLRSLFRERGIEASNLVEEPGRVTPHKIRIAAHQQQLLRLDFERPHAISAKTARLLSQRLERRAARLDALIVSDYLKGCITTELCSEVSDMARSRRIPVLVDPKPEHSEICRGASVITPNLREAESMAGLPLRDAEARRAAAPRLRASLGCSALVITRGGEGMTVVESDGRLHEIPSVPRPVYDVTGAGDTVIAVLALASAAGATLREAAELANLAGGSVVLKFGTATLTSDELLTTLREQGR
jgi:rfaE bifunctional protein kinase chain/domain